MNIETIREVFSDAAFVQSLFEMETVSEVQEALGNRGVQLSEEEIMGIHTLLTRVEQGEISREQLEEWIKLAENGELSEEILDQVAGGSVVALTLLGIGLSAAAVASIALPIGIAHAVEHRW